MVGLASMVPRVRLVSSTPHQHRRASTLVGACWLPRPIRLRSQLRLPNYTAPLPLLNPLLPVPRHNSLFLASCRPSSTFVSAKHGPFIAARWSGAVSCAAEIRVSSHKRVYLQPGVLIEFKNDSGEIVLGVTQSRDGKRWNVLDQNAETCTVRPKQVNVVVPGAQNFQPEDVCELLRQVESLQDQTRLEVAWEEMVASNRTIDLEELALVLYGSITPDKCYSAYRLLTSCPIYFECKDDSYSPLYEPRPPEQVRQLRLQKLEEDAACKKVADFVTLVRSTMQLPPEKKPKRTSWDLRIEFQTQIKSLTGIALGTSITPEAKKTGMQVLDALGVAKSSAGALSVMTEIGYFGIHENFDLLKPGFPSSFSDQAIEAVKTINARHPYDLDKDDRVDLTLLKVLTIDTDNPKEIDDGLSAVELPDGRLKVWIHVADPIRWVDWNNILRKEASHRGTSIYLPTTTIPMFPMELSWNLMSLRRGHCRPAISISAILSEDGSVAEAFVENAVICPTYNFSYEAATELLSLDLKEETELSILYRAAALRKKWRRSNGASIVSMPRSKVRVEGEETADPKITITVEDENSPSAIVVSEMMILCGEIIAKFGGQRGLCLPYRCQAQREEINKEAYSIPEGPARSLVLLRSSSRADLNFMKPSPHASLGLAGYVQFTSPIRRYADLLAHCQIKAVLRGENPPLLAGYLEASMVTVTDTCRTAKRLQLDSERYWILEYLRRQPAERKYHACILRIVKNTLAVIFLTELGLQNLMDLRSKRQPGEEVFVHVVDAQPRKRFLQLRES